MKQILLVMAVFVLCAATALGGRDKREERAARGQDLATRSFASLPRTTAIPQFAPLGIQDSVSSFQGIDAPAGAIWITGSDNNVTTFYGYKSTNDGATWTKFTIAAPTGTGQLTNVAAKNASIAVLGIDIGQLIRTTDGGATWNVVFSYLDPNNTTPFFDGVMCVGTSRDTMLAFGDADTGGVCIVRSVDAGATWKRIKPAVGDSVNEPNWYAGYVTFGQAMEVYGTNVWMPLYFGSSQNPRMLYSPDAGNTWQVWQFTLPGGKANAYYLRSINFLDATHGWGVIRQVATGSTYWAVKTSDGGKTWSDTINVEPGISHSDAKPITVKPIRGTSNVFAGGFGTLGAKAWWSSDSGKTWTNMHIPLGASSNAEIENAWFKDATHGYAIGTEINLKLTPATAVGEAPNGLPGAYALNQNYPNPFNPVTTIDYSLAKEGNVQLAVYDVLGRLVTTLADGVQGAGQHTVRFDASRLSSGVYFYTLRAGEFTATRSLILMK